MIMELFGVKVPKQLFYKIKSFWIVKLGIVEHHGQQSGILSVMGDMIKKENFFQNEIGVPKLHFPIYL